MSDTVPLEYEGAVESELNAEAAKVVKKTARLNIDLPPRSSERLERLKEMTEASSYVEVIRNAIRLYEALVMEGANGNTIMIREKDGTIGPLHVF